MTYLQFHLVFILPPIVLLALTGWPEGRWVRAMLAMAAVALLYTTPWDNYLVWRGVWIYGPGRVLGTIGWVPLEEYLFFLLQPLLTGLWLHRVLRGESPAPGAAPVWPGVAGYGALAVLGAGLLLTERGTYLGLILAWAAPVLALQWGWGGELLLRQRRALLLGVAVPTAYLWIADAVALHLGIWSISARHTLEIALGPLPLEEAVFFLVTNVLVVQGLLLVGRPAAAAA